MEHPLQYVGQVVRGMDVAPEVFQHCLGSFLLGSQCCCGASVLLDGIGVFLGYIRGVG
jgi:hypothetical protein